MAATVSSGSRFVTGAKLSALAACVCIFAVSRPAIAVTDRWFVGEEPGNGRFRIVDEETAAALLVDKNDWPGTVRAAKDLQRDVQRVSGVEPKLAHIDEQASEQAIIIGTVGRSALIDRLARERRIDVSKISGKWEAALLQVVDRPLPGIQTGLVIAGSDKRGTIFGIYELCEQIGVSPWHWWADVPPRQRSRLYVEPGPHLLGPPAVKYRGIFINDEGPCLMSWARERYGELNHGMYTNVFELILRLKGNFLWPAMWDNSFSTDDPLNPKLADEYGVVISTSHHEPMMRAWKEWERAGNKKGSWDYSKNPAALREFWREGLRRTKDYENVVTLAMRGDGDEPMSENESVALLEKIVADQREIIRETLGPEVETVPQVWALYKEVQGYYERGMRVPDDVTLLWCDDNWGNIRRLPTVAERGRAGGAGIYYHFDYVGGPRNYKWLNTVPITKVWEQMSMAWNYGADRIWVVNAGDIKPMEFPIEFFLTFAWNPQAWPKERLGEFTRLWAEREFGPSHAADIADIVGKYTKYNSRRKPELLDSDTYSLTHYNEAERVLADWQTITAKAEGIHEALPKESRDAFYQLVLHPVKASAVVAELYITVGRNRLYAAQGRPTANKLAARARELFQEDASLSLRFNEELSGGKWNHMMDQTHIGYTYWQQPEKNHMPAVAEVHPPSQARMAVAIEASTLVWPGEASTPALPVFDIFNQQTRFIDIFNRGTKPFEFAARTGAAWVSVSETAGKVDSGEHRLRVSIDWEKAPKGANSARVALTSAESDPVFVRVDCFNPASPTREAAKGFVETEGCVSIEAEHYSRKHDVSGARWELIPDYGRARSGMAVFPQRTLSVSPPEGSPILEYDMHLFSTGAVEVAWIIAPTLNIAPNRGLRFAVSFDKEPPQTIVAVPKGFYVDNGNRDWEESVRLNCRQLKSAHTISSPGPHTLKVWMVDPGIVLERIVVDTGGVKPSYLGPQESFRR